MMDRKSFFAAFVAFCSALFALNFFHQAQQVIYAVRFVPLAENIFEHLAYLGAEGNVASYPMWGYAILMALTNSLAGFHGVLIFQYLLLLASFWLIARLCPLPGLDRPLEAAVFYGALLFYTMLMSVKWPAAVVGFLLLAFAASHQRKHYALAAGLLLLAYNFRTEGLGLWAVYVICLLVGRVEVTARTWMRLGLVSAALVAAWPSYQYVKNQEFTLTTTNSGAVLYMSLGQLPNNPWGRIYDDHAVKEDASAMGIDDPWGFEGNARLKQEFFDNVKEHPGGFGRKVFYNYLSLLKGGLYVSELRTLAIRGDKKRDLSQKTLAGEYQSQPSRLISDLIRLRLEAWLLASQLGLMLVSVVYLILVLALLAWRLVSRRLSLLNPYLWIIAAQLGLAGLVQYEPRHMSGVLLLFVFALLPLRGEAERQVGSTALRASS